MLALFPGGFEEVERADGLELAGYVEPGGEERVWRALGPGRSEEVVLGWEVAWRSFHRPLRVGPLWVGPGWEEPDADALALVVDPGRAFGTGGHPTTRLCLELLLEEERGSVVDLGCGSGVLAIAAARLGFAPVVALDADEAAVEIAGVTAAVNDVAVQVVHADVTRDPLPSADLAFANLSLELVELVAARADAARLVASGYLARDRPSPAGWRRLERRERDGWAADLFVRTEPRAGAGG